MPILNWQHARCAYCSSTYHGHGGPSGTYCADCLNALVLAKRAQRDADISRFQGAAQDRQRGVERGAEVIGVGA